MRKALVLEDVRISGLLTLIRQYKTLAIYDSQCGDSAGSAIVEEGKSPESQNEGSGDEGTGYDGSSGDGDAFIPKPRFRLQKKLTNI